MALAMCWSLTQRCPWAHCTWLPGICITEPIVYGVQLMKNGRMTCTPLSILSLARYSSWGTWELNLFYAVVTHTQSKMGTAPPVPWAPCRAVCRRILHLPWQKSPSDKSIESATCAFHHWNLPEGQMFCISGRKKMCHQEHSQSYEGEFSDNSGGPTDAQGFKS